VTSTVSRGGWRGRILLLVVMAGCAVLFRAWSAYDLPLDPTDPDFDPVALVESVADLTYRWIPVVVDHVREVVEDATG